MSKIEALAIGLANYICNPVDNIEIGGLSEQLIQIIRTQTELNSRLRDKVRYWIEYNIEVGDFTVKEYAGNVDLAISDYEKIFL